MEAQTKQPEPSRFLIYSAWAITLIASLLPDIILREWAGAATGWLVWARLAVFALLFVLSWPWKKLRPLRGFVAVWLILYAAADLLPRLNFNLPVLQDILGGGSFTRQMQPEQFGKLAVALVMIAGLSLLGYRRKQLFLTPGKLDAPIAPVKWMGFPKPDPWWRFGGQYGIYIPLGMALVAWLVGRPTAAMMARSLPALPAILLFAAMNAFYEEMTFRASMLATLETPVGSRQAWWMSAAYFGIAHFYGVPYGWVGVLLAAFNGWLLGKAMLETRGMFWAWAMHFLQDVVIFTFLAAGAITPGG